MNNALFLIMEEDLKDRFKFFESETGLAVHQLNLKNTLKRSKLQTVFSRLTYKKNLLSEYEKLKGKLQNLSKIYISNPEGYIAKNIIFFIRRDFPRLEIISLQHGIFALREKSKLHLKLKSFVNKILKPFLGYFPIGDGFGDITTDKYIVYNALYKQFLIDQGWSEKNVFVSSFLLKGEKKVEPIEFKNSTKVIFFLQCLHKLGITDFKTEMNIIKTVTNKLSKKYTEVLIKQHPYAQIELPELPANAFVIEKIPNLDEIGLVVSSFSTALLEYEKFGIKTVAMKSGKLNVDPSVYDQFLYIHDLDEVSDEFSYIKNEKRKDLEVFFEIGITDLEML